MSRGSARWAVYAALVVVYLLHNDLWLWDDPRIVLGLPVGLTYHVGFSLLAALMMFLLVRYAWPEEFEAMDVVEPSGTRGIPTFDELVEEPAVSGPDASGTSQPGAAGGSGPDAPDERDPGDQRDPGDRGGPGDRGDPGDQGDPEHDR